MSAASFQTVAAPASAGLPARRQGIFAGNVPAGRRRPNTTPRVLALLMTGLVVASLAWGAVTALAVSQHSSAASGVVSTGEPLSFDAHQMYQSLSDADVTATTAFLAGLQEPLSVRARYDADISRAAADLAALTAARSSPRLGAELAVMSAGLPVYTGYVAEARGDYALGHQLTGAGFLQVASEQMHLTLLPTALSISATVDGQLKAQSAQATGLPWIVIALLLSVGLGFALIRAQRWLTRRTQRTVNYGMLGATAALVVVTLWLLAAFGVARGDLQQGEQHGLIPAGTLARAATDVQQARGDEVLNVISRTGSTSFQQDFGALQHRLGPGPGTLLTDGAAAGASSSVPAADAAVRDAPAFYQASSRIFSTSLVAEFATDRQLVLGSGAGSSQAAFNRLQTDLTRAIGADQAHFSSSAAAASGAFGALLPGIAIATILMAGGCAWGLSRRLAEYR
jgi:hypothetical protein